MFRISHTRLVLIYPLSENLYERLRVPKKIYFRRKWLAISGADVLSSPKALKLCQNGCRKAIKSLAMKKQVINDSEKSHIRLLNFFAKFNTKTVLKKLRSFFCGTRFRKTCIGAKRSFLFLRPSKIKRLEITYRHYISKSKFECIFYTHHAQCINLEKV